MLVRDRLHFLSTHVTRNAVNAVLLKQYITTRADMEDEKKQKFLLEKHKDIARIDQESKRTHGWYVRVRFVGRTHSKFFSDRKCGGRYSSLLSAISWRDKTEKKLGKIRTNKHMVTVSNSGTGVVGVRLNEKLNRFEVSWVTHQGKQGKTSVSITKHGKKIALARAIAIRQEKEKARLEYSI
jgi:hypothetical protein